MTRVLPSPFTIHVPRLTSHSLPCAEGIEKTLTHRKLPPLQGFNNGMPQISSRSSDAEIDPICQLSPSGQERKLFPGPYLIHLRDITTMIVRQDEQAALTNLLLQPVKPSIKTMWSHDRLCSI